MAKEPGEILLLHEGKTLFSLNLVFFHLKKLPSNIKHE